MSFPSIPVREDVRLSEALTLGVIVPWHEAVALVRHCGRRLAEAPQGDRGVPALDGITLRRHGVVQLATTSGDDRDLVRGLCSLLGVLLGRSAPEALRALTEVGRTDGANIDKFLESLSFFARPDDVAELSALAERAVEASASHARAATLHALTERARHLPPVPAAPHPIGRKSRRIKAMAAMAAMFLIGSAAAWAGWDRRSRQVLASTGGGVAAGPAHSVHVGVKSALAFVKEALQGPPAAPEPVDIIRPSVAPQPRRRKSLGREVPRSSGASSLSAPEDEGSVRLPTVTPAGEAREASEGAAVGGAQAPEQTRVYSRVDPEVVPPALVRSQMPEVPIGGLPIERRGTLDLTVGEDGQVVSARLRAQSGRHQERMMVSAAKTWRFRPAMHEGRPVPYRLEMPVTW